MVNVVFTCYLSGANHHLTRNVGPAVPNDKRLLFVSVGVQPPEKLFLFKTRSFRVDDYAIREKS